MDLQAIADAIAGRFVSITATNGSETETVTGTADLPNSVGRLALLVYPPSGTLEIGVSAARTDLYSFEVKLLRDPLNVPSRTRWLYAWYDAIHDRVALDMDLGLPSYIDIAETSAVRIAIDGEQYSSTDGVLRPFDVVELTVTVRIYEHVTGIGA